MEYIIPTETEINELNKLFMTFDNSVLNIEYCLERIRQGINSYLLVDGISLVLQDLMLSVIRDPMLMNRCMTVWVALVVKMHYYIVSIDILLPISELNLNRSDVCIVTDG